MKRLKEVPDAVLKHIKKEHERTASHKIARYIYFCTLPTRPARMQVLLEHGVDFVQTIVPPTSIYLASHAFLDGEHIDRDCLAYFVAGTQNAFPLAHVYSGSGNICLGSIFVPNKVSRYTPQQPLETLFLHNDRVLNHGGASLRLDKETVRDVAGILRESGIELSENMLPFLKADYELLKEDGIWRIAAEVYQQKEDLRDAVNVMDMVYKRIFIQECET